MSLTSPSLVLAIPGLSNPGISATWLNNLIAAADRSIKSYCKRDLEVAFYSETYSGQGQRDIWLRQWPLLTAQAQVTSASNGVALPTGTINVTSTVGFPDGSLTPTITVQTGIATWTTVTYTGQTATSFTGCTGGTGTLSSAAGSNGISSPVVFYDPSGYGGQSANAFQAGTILVQGTQFMVEIDNGAVNQLSNRGLLRKIGGPGQGWVGYQPEVLWQGKLAGQRLPVWPRGDFNVKVLYAAGYTVIPDDLAFAASTLVAQMARTQPTGANLSSEGLGSYNYSVLMNEDNPAMGDIRRILATYREVSFGD